MSRVGEQDKDFRVSDAERDAVIAALGEHASVGRLTPEEFDDRSSRALVAKTRGDLDALTTDLPDGDAPVARPAPAPGGAHWLVSILSSSLYTARSRAVRVIHSISILGSGEIDLRNAEFEGGELTVNAYALLGSPDIFVPDSVEVETGGICILGKIDDHGTARVPRTGAPVVRLRTFALLGGADVYRVPSELRGQSTREIRLRMTLALFGALGHDGPLDLGGPFGPRGRLGPRERRAARGRPGRFSD